MHSTETCRNNPIAHSFIGFKSFHTQRGMSRLVMRKRVHVEIIRMQYPSELSTLYDLFGECALKGPRCSCPTVLSPVLHLQENDPCNPIVSEFLPEDEALYYSQSRMLLDKSSDKAGIDFVFDGAGNLRIVSRYFSVVATKPTNYKHLME